MIGILDPTRTGAKAELLGDGLRRAIVGQDEAILQIVNIYQMYLAGLTAPGRPAGNLLFLGPTGSGKTRIVEALAEILAGSSRAVVKIDCGEFQHSHEIAKLIGSPPGYLGHRETHPLLSQRSLDQYHTETLKLSFVLFDEIEKASDALWNLLLGILDKATLTLGDNSKVDFSHSMIFMTGNIGAGEISSILTPKWGFATAPSLRDNQAATKRISQAGIEASRRKFTPEFMNRLDKIAVFNPLGEAELRKILAIELDLVRLRISKPFTFKLSAAVEDHILQQGTDLKYGARHLKRAIDRLLVQPLSNLIATEQVLEGDSIRAELDPELKHLIFVKESERASVKAGGMAA